MSDRKRRVEWEAVEKEKERSAMTSPIPAPRVPGPASGTDAGSSGSAGARPSEPESAVDRDPEAEVSAAVITAFDSNFDCLTGHGPFPWQRALFREFMLGRFPSACDIPTGLGKTSIIAIWLLALAHDAGSRAASFPRRLVYVVNRRTVVDQATREAEAIRAALSGRRELDPVAASLRSMGAVASDVPVAISTLRGQFADNAEWRDDPARPAVIVGTVDMIGSRLLFGGYGCGFKSRPLHAGFLGQDALLVHDEAHLEPAFQALATAIESEQRRRREFRRFRVLALTATTREAGSPFLLTAADRGHAVVRKRIFAKKRITLFPVSEENSLPDEIVKRALEHEDDAQAILVFLRRLEHLEKVADKLRKATSPERVQVLTGTMRGLERDALAAGDAVFARFKPRSVVSRRAGTVYLVCTSAGEVGVDISADHMVCDLTPFDSMAQRLGRVNRFGEGAARITVVYPEEFDKKDALSEPRKRTLALLQTLPHAKDGHDASPAALGELPAAERMAAFTPAPTIRPSSDILFDAWALTSIRERLPGRPPVADWLHGVADWEPPETHVAWRDEVGLVRGEMVEASKAGDLLEDYPLKPHELLRDRTARVLKHLEALAERCPEAPVWLIEGDGGVRVLSLVKLVEKDGQKRTVATLEGATVLLPPEVGGLANGMLEGKAAQQDTVRYDVADEWRNEQGVSRRRRVWDDDEVPPGMRLVRSIDMRPEGDDEQDAEPPSRRFWRWFVRPRSADDDGSRTASQPQELAPHLGTSARHAAAIVLRLGLGEPEAPAVIMAAGSHDLGKRRAIWQRSIGNRDPGLVLAKSGGKMQPLDLTAYRHEFGSLLDLPISPDFKRAAPEVQDLALHLIAAHHGRARPHFPPEEAMDPEHVEADADSAASEVPRRFARLQRKYGRWGLAFLESLVRAADALASQGIEPSAGIGLTAPTISKPGATS